MFEQPVSVSDAVLRAFFSHSSFSLLLALPRGKPGPGETVVRHLSADQVEDFSESSETANSQEAESSVLSP